LVHEIPIGRSKKIAFLIIGPWNAYCHGEQQKTACLPVSPWIANWLEQNSKLYMQSGPLKLTEEQQKRQTSLSAYWTFLKRQLENSKKVISPFWVGHVLLISFSELI
jgi:hypothetical protein